MRKIHLAALVCSMSLGLSSAMAADGAWKFEVDPRDHPILTYSENGKTVFLVACGRAFGLHARYPGAAGKEGKASIVLANPKTKMVVDGEFQETDEADLTDFVQWDLGFSRQDPKLYGKGWGRIRSKLLDLIASGPLTVSAENRSYRLPAVKLPKWKAALEKCGG